MMLRVKLFAAARQWAGREEVEVELPDGGTLGDLRERLVAAHPPLAAVVTRSMFAVNADYAGDERTLSPDDEIACIPPVSGG